MESACHNANQTRRYWCVSIMGPYSEDKQMERAESIKRLLDHNPQLDRLYRIMWENKLRALATNEESYNARVKATYSHLEKKPIIDWG